MGKEKREQNRRDEEKAVGETKKKINGKKNVNAMNNRG
jgi:hypothetical protein